MFSLNEITSYLKVVARSIKFQISSTISFGAGLFLLVRGNDYERIIFTILFLFPCCMLVCSISERVGNYFKNKEQQRREKVQRKLGQLAQYEFTNKLPELWKDEEFDGLGWEICINNRTSHAFLTNPCCYDCKTNLVIRVNSKGDGVLLECNKCKKKFDVDDIGKKRAKADSILQGDVRKHPGQYFSFPY